MEEKKLSQNFLLTAAILLAGLISLLFQDENLPVWLIYTIIGVGLIYLKPVFDGWLRPFWKLLLGLCGFVLLMQALLLFYL